MKDESSTENTNTPTETSVPKSELSEAIAALHADVQPKHSISRQKKVTLIILFVALIAAAFLVRAINGKPESRLVTTPPPAVQAPQKEVTPTAPYAVVYSTKEAGPKTKDCYLENSNVTWRPLQGGQGVVATKVMGGSVGGYDIKKNRVLFTTSSGCGSNDGPSLLFSKDSGKSYSKIALGKSGTFNERDQITSAKFSGDGKKIIVAKLLADRSKNIVSEVDTESKSVRELFSVTQAGVFLEGYDTVKNQVFYYQGCYNCDGNTFDKLLVRDLAKGTDTALFEEAKLITTETAANKDFSKFLLVKGTEPEQFLGTSQPYVIQELDVATKTLKTLLTINQDVRLDVGFSEEDLPWYSNNKQLFSLEAGSTAPLFEASSYIDEVYYFGKGQIIANISDNSKFDIVDYSIANKKATTRFSGGEEARIYGIAWK